MDGPSLGQMPVPGWDLAKLTRQQSPTLAVLYHVWRSCRGRTTWTFPTVAIRRWTTLQTTTPASTPRWPTLGRPSILTNLPRRPTTRLHHHLTMARWTKPSQRVIPCCNNLQLKLQWLGRNHSQGPWCYRSHFRSIFGQLALIQWLSCSQQLMCSYNAPKQIS